MTGPLLVILPHNPGDVVMALAALARVRDAYPGLSIDYVIGEECRELAEGNPLLRAVHALPRRALRSAWEAGDAGAVIARLEAFIAGLDAAGYAYSLNLFQEHYGGVLQGLLRAGRKAGLELVAGKQLAVKSRFLEHLFAVPAARGQNAWHAVDIFVRAACELLSPGARIAVPPPGARAILPPLQPPAGWDGPVPKAYLAFHPGSAWPGKRWSERHWSFLAEACARRGLAVVLTGSEEEAPSLRRIRDAVATAARAAVHDWSGRTTLIGAAWIHSRARMTITGDTVAMHLAAACGTPTLAFFGPSNPVETGPYGPGHFVWRAAGSLGADLELGRTHAGLEALAPEAVAAFVLDGAPPSGADLWETARDGSRDCQILRNARGEAHPALAGAAGLMDLLDGRAQARSEARLSEPAAAVEAALRRAVAEGPTSPNLRDLEAADRHLADSTADSIVWEAYRIAVNGLPLEDIREHLELRRERFRQALREEATLAGTGAPGGA